MAEMASQKLLFFGVHGDSPADQQLAARLMGKIASKLKDKAAIGLEQVIIPPPPQSRQRAPRCHIREVPQASLPTEPPSCRVPWTAFISIVSLSHRREINQHMCGVSSQSLSGKGVSL